MPLPLLTEREAINQSPVFNIAAYQIAGIAELVFSELMFSESDLILVLCLISALVWLCSCIA